MEVNPHNSDLSSRTPKTNQEKSANLKPPNSNRVNEDRKDKSMSTNSEDGNGKPSRAKEDQELVRRAVESQDQLAFAKLMERYKDSIYFMVLKMVNNRDDADDLTIEAFGKAFSNIEKYSPNYAFSTWLFKIAVNNCIDFIRKKRLETLSMDSPVGNNDENSDYKYNIKAATLDPEEKYIKEQRKSLTQEVVEKLPEKYKRLIQLRYFEEYSYDEIATEMSLPLGTVKAQLFRAKELLYNILRRNRSEY